MTVLIVEDEAMSRARLARNIGARFPDLTIVGMTDSVASTVAWLDANPTPDIIFMDVELSDGDALAVKDLHPSWESFIGKEMKAKTRVTYGDKLFRVRQDINPVLENQPPSIDTAALYEEINETNAGTLDDPIPYNNNMELFAGKYYSQDGTVYKCTRDTGQAVYQDLADLVGIYVEAVK